MPAVGEREDHELTAAEQAALKDLMAKPPPPQSMAMGADRFHYKVTIQDDKGSSVLHVPERSTGWSKSNFGEFGVRVRFPFRFVIMKPR